MGIRQHLGQLNKAAAVKSLESSRTSGARRQDCGTSGQRNNYPRYIMFRRYLTGCLMVAGLILASVPAWTQPQPNEPGTPRPGGLGFPLPGGQGFPPGGPGIPQPGGPCGLHQVNDLSFVPITLVAQANGPFKVTLTWSGPEGLYHLSEEAGPYEADVNVGRPVFRQNGSQVPTTAVQEPALPSYNHRYVIKAQLPDGRTACGTASVTTSPPPPITLVSSKYAETRKATINYDLPPFITLARILRPPRPGIEQPNPVDPDILPYATGNYDTSVANYPFIL
jgi:hypothetical protein